MDRRLLLQALGAAGLAAGAAHAAPAGAITVQSVADAWIAGLGIIEMAAARRRMTDPSSAGQHAGLNAFRHTRRLVGPSDHAITTPNNDTLYSSAWFDLSRGPVTLTVPESRGRYLSVALMDMHTNNNVVLGARTKGGAAGTYTLVGPGYSGPIGPRTLKLKTAHGWALARILIDGEADLAAAHAVQDGVTMSGPKPGPYPITALRSDDWPAYFRSLDQLLASDPPESWAGFAGFRAMKARAPSFERAAFGDDAKIIDAGVAQARAFILGARGAARFDDGWSYPARDLGDFGEDFRYRGIVAVVGLAALPNFEAMYMRAAGDTGKAIFTGDQTWRFSIPAALPVDAFWSVTMYEATADGQFFLSENPLHRYAIGDRTPGLKKSANGGLDLYIGRTDPGGDRTSNWLPAPARGPYAISLRTYLPREELMQGRYRLPPLVAV